MVRHTNLRHTPFVALYIFFTGLADTQSNLVVIYHDTAECALTYMAHRLVENCMTYEFQSDHIVSYKCNPMHLQ